MSDTNNNQNADFNQDNTGSVNSTGQNTDYNNGQYYDNPQAVGNGQNYNPNADYNNGQYYNQNADYNNGQYYNQNADYNNGQYYNQNADYGNGQYYDQNNGYNNGQYSGYGQQGYNNEQSGGYGQQQGYNNGQYGNYGQQQGYNNGQYGGYGQQGYNNGQYGGYGQQGYNNGQYGNYYGQQSYNNGQQPYPYAQSEPVNEPVTNVFYYILMALTAVSVIVGLIVSTSLIRDMLSSMDFVDAVAGADFAYLYSTMMNNMSASGGYALYSVLNSLLSVAILVFSIIDIVVCHKKGYPIVGLILFTILFKLGYFLWRAHVVGQKKTIPVLFTVGYVVLYFVYFIWTFSYMMSIVM